MKNINLSGGLKGGIYCPSAKVRFENEEEGKMAARRGMLESRDTAVLSTYECQWCAGWHLTSRPYDNDKTHKSKTSKKRK